MQETRIVLLGTGNPNPDPLRSGPCVAIIVNHQPYLIDFGPGVVRRAATAALQGMKSLAAKNLTRAFVTHLHSDHTVGFADLIFTPWVMGRNEPLEVYGPPGIRHMAEHVSAAYKEDIEMRLHGLEHAHPAGYVVNAHEVKPGWIYEDANVKVRAFRVKHGSWKHAYGYRFETANRTIVISGDTVAHPNIEKYSQGCDVLIHEVFSQKGLNRVPPGWRKYHTHFHTSSVELAKIAKKTKPGLLILTHQLYFGSTEEELLGEIRKIYKGKVVSGHDLEVF